MIAAADFTATLNGATYKLKKGAEFEGDAIAASHLESLGLLSEKPKETKSKKADKAKEEEVIQDER